MCGTGALGDTADGDAVSPQTIVPPAAPFQEAVAVTTTLAAVTLELNDSAGAVLSQMDAGDGAGEGAGPGAGGGAGADVVPESGLVGAGPEPGGVGAGLEPPDA